jgi:hypothetical protein
MLIPKLLLWTKLELRRNYGLNNRIWILLLPTKLPPALM